MTSQSKRIKPVNRAGYWYLYRRVPAEFVHLETRKHVTWSTGIAVYDDPRGFRAQEIVAERYQWLLRHWQDRLHGGDSPSPDAYVHAQNRASERGLTYKPAASLAALDLCELFKRFRLLANIWGEDALSNSVLTSAIRSDVQVILGGIPEPIYAKKVTARTLMVSGMIDEYRRINSTILKPKSVRQSQKWNVGRQSHLDLFTRIIGGDKPFAALTRDDAKAYRAHWQNRIDSGEVRINSANRMIRQVSGLYSAIRDYHMIDGQHIFEKLFFRGGEEGKRVAFASDFVQKHYLAEGVFDALNPEARRLIYLIIETGLRVSEASALDRSTIVLDAHIPYVVVQALNRTTKTKHAVRKIPLVGVALMAMKAQRNGFPRYHDKGDVASSTINKFLDEHHLRPLGKNQTIYSMRHTIVDRLSAVEAPEIIKEDMLGHKHMYGDGTTLEHRHAWLQKIAFKPPSRV